jgi:hypothetical protein
MKTQLNPHNQSARTEGTGAPNVRAAAASLPALVPVLAPALGAKTGVGPAAGVDNVYEGKEQQCANTHDEPKWEGRGCMGKTGLPTT